MKKTLLPLLLTIVINATAQEMPYTVTVLNEPYVPLSEAISVLENETWDDPDVLAPVGFTFQLIDEAISQIYISGPGGQIISTAQEDSLNFLAPYLADLIDVGYDTASLSPLRYSIDGPPGYQIFKLEYANAGFYDEVNGKGTANNIVNFQMWLYQGSNIIEYRFGPNNVPDSQTLQFLGGPLIGLGTGAPNGGGWQNFWILGGNPQEPTISNWTDFNTMPTVLDGEPADSTVYRFAPTFVGVEENNTTEIFKIFPSVAENNIQLTLKSNTTVANIYNSVGSLVFAAPVTRGQQTLDIQALSPGSYIITIEADHTIYRQQFIKL
jgi:Secretion system C-terminal sorting domain